MEIDLMPAGHTAALPVAIIVRMIAPEPTAKEVRSYFDPVPLGPGEMNGVANGSAPS